MAEGKRRSVERERVGGPAQGASAHGPDCGCTRCVGFTSGSEHIAGPGNERALVHGAYSPGRLREVAEEEYAALRAVFVPWDPAYEMAARTLAELRARMRLVLAWLDEKGVLDEQGEPWPIVRELPRWERRATELFRELALTVRSRVELDIDRLAVERGMLALEEHERIARGWQDVILWVLEESRTGRVPSNEKVLARLRAQFEIRDDGVVEGSARQLGSGERDAAIRAEYAAHEPACPVRREGLGAVCRCRHLRGEVPPPAPEEDEERDGSDSA